MIKRSLLAAILALHISAFAQSPVRYTVSLANPEKHLVQVTMELPPGAAVRALQLPVWNALYQVRDFSQFMNWIHAEDADSHPLQLDAMNPSRWKLEGTTKGARVEYEMFTNSPGPFGAQLNEQHAFLNLAQILLYADDQRSAPVVVQFRNVPRQWKIATPLVQQGNAYLAENYDRLVDSPVELSNFEESDVAANCGQYHIVVDPGDLPNARATINKITPSIQRIVTSAAAWMNDCPFHVYTFIYHFSEAPERGGMEHAYGTAITLSPAAVEQNLAVFNGITAHEFFHLWNVKRIRPQSLEPIDYTKENYTKALWFSEGVDSTVSGYVLLRAGLLDERSYLQNLGQAITELENEPAHLTQSVEQSSLDAWLEKYSYYNLPDRSISYYNKGELVGVLLDLQMRTATHDQVSLQELFRYMNEHYAKAGKFFPDTQGVRESAEALTHATLGDFFARYVSGVAEIPWDTFFAPVGLRVHTSVNTIAERGFDAVQKFDQPVTVARVQPGSAAEHAGLRPNDAITHINGQAVDRNLDKQIDALGPGAVIRLTITRDGVQREIHWTLAARKMTLYVLEDVPNLTAEERARRSSWLFGKEAGSR